MSKVAVVGCGAIGLTTALAIQKKIPNATVTIFSKDFTPNTTSDIAAGFWEPYLLGETPSEKIYKWSKGTYDYLVEMWKDGKAKEAGITLLPVTYLTDDPKFDLPEWLNIVLGYKKFSKEELEMFGKQYNQELTAGLHFVSFTWEGAIFLLYLQQEFLTKGGQIIQKEIQDLEELSNYDVVVNCTGIDARILTEDKSVYPIRGQVMRAKLPWAGHVYLLDTKNTCYIIPNHHSVVLGGTKQTNYNLEIDQHDIEDILRKCSLVLPSIKSAEIIKHQVGLRPARDKVRLEAEIKRTTSGKGVGGAKGKSELRIVHNYGHGGAGVTLAVGCAEEAADLVEGLLGGEARNKL